MSVKYQGFDFQRLFISYYIKINKYLELPNRLPMPVLENNILLENSVSREFCASTHGY